MSIVVQKESGEVISDSYVEIAKYVAKTRAYSSILDGMKTVYRRMVYASKSIHGKVKSNIITAETQKFHPHGDAYGTLVSMACKYGQLPLYKSYGNFGGAGFAASASRYTSAELNEIGRLMYLELVDYADYEEGDAGIMEPTYLPSLIPYSLITGNKGMTVGLPTPNIPSFNLMDLINYCKSKLTGEECKYPRPDYGDCYLNCTEEDLIPLYENGHGTVWYKVKYSVIGNKIIITDLPPGHRHWTAWRKLNNYIESGDIDFLEDVDENGLRYEYVINDSSRISIDEVLDLFRKYENSKETYRMYFEKNGSVYLCSLNYIIEESQKYLKLCAVRKFSKEEESIKNRIKIFEAINMLKESEELKEISSKSSEYFKNLIKSWGFSVDIANSVMNKSISYLTNSHDNEYNSLKEELTYISQMKYDPTEYLISLYDRLIELVTPLYMSRRHSNWISEAVDTSLIGFKFENSHIITGMIEDGYMPSNGMMYEVYDNGRIRPQYINKEVGMDIESDCLKVVSGINPKYVLVVWENYMSVIPVNNIVKDRLYLKVWDGYSMKDAFIAESNLVRIYSSKGSYKDINLSDWVKKRISLPSKLFKDNESIEKVEEKGE